MRSVIILKLFCFFALFASVIGVSAQTANISRPKSSASSEDSTPIIVKHLPELENVQKQAVYITKQEDLRKTLGERPVLGLINFTGGTEAASASYDAGKLLIVEYGNPQFSIDADNQISQFLAINQTVPQTFARRVGNYEVFVFDAVDENAANQLIDQVKYEKSVQWLGQDPTIYQRAKQAYSDNLEKTGNVFVSTVVSIVLGLGFAVCLGIASGLLIFYIRRQKRTSMQTFSDAGGMVRLNLDELTSEISADRLLKE